MKRKGIIYTLTGLFMAGLFVAGGISVMAEYGDSSDPLISKSYIDSILTPEVEAKIDAAIADNEELIEKYMSEQLSSHKAVIDRKIAEIESGNISLSQSVIDSIAEQVVEDIKKEGIAVGTSWQVVSIPAGSALVGQVGTGIVLRIGSASVYSTGNVGIVNLSSGAMLDPGKSLAANNLYLVSIAERGVKAGNGGATVLVSGSYVIK